MKNTMSRAHEIRREAAAKWNCNVSEIVFSICLEMAWRETSKMNLKEVVSWELTDGRNASVTIELISQDKVNCDGHVVTVNACYQAITGRIDGETTGYHIQTIKNHAHCAAKIGKLGLTFENYRLVREAISKIESSTEWQDKLDRDGKKAAAQKKDYERKKANGYCFRCGSYCHGDCSI